MGRAFEGGLAGAQEHFDPILTRVFEQQGAGEFQGIWLNRMASTGFDDVDFAIYFQREAHVTGRVVGEEVQHALDFVAGGTRSSIAAAAERQGILGEALGDWWHRRVFTRLIQNIAAEQHGLDALRPYVGDVYDAYRAVGGRLTMEQIRTTSFTGLY